jgi:hypothetical protein
MADDDYDLDDDDEVTPTPAWSPPSTPTPTRARLDEINARIKGGLIGMGEFNRLWVERHQITRALGIDTEAADAQVTAPASPATKPAETAIEREARERRENYERNIAAGKLGGFPSGVSAATWLAAEAEREASRHKSLDQFLNESRQHRGDRPIGKL